MSLNEIQKKILKEIENVKKGVSNKNPHQLIAILNELKRMEDGEKIVLSYPRYIIDSWDYQDELGIELLTLAEQYKRCK